MSRWEGAFAGFLIFGGLIVLQSIFGEFRNSIQVFLAALAITTVFAWKIVHAWEYLVVHICLAVVAFVALRLVGIDEWGGLSGKSLTFLSAVTFLPWIAILFASVAFIGDSFSDD